MFVSLSYTCHIYVVYIGSVSFTAEHLWMQEKKRKKKKRIMLAGTEINVFYSALLRVCWGSVCIKHPVGVKGMMLTIMYRFTLDSYNITYFKFMLSVSVCLSVCLPACLPACLPVCLHAYLSVCLSVCQSFWHPVGIQGMMLMIMYSFYSRQL